MRVFAICAAVCISAQAAAADDNFGSVRGTVILGGIAGPRNGAPICRLNVFLHSPTQGELRTQTARDGSYVFLGVLPGDVEVVMTSYLSRRAHVSPMMSTQVDAVVSPLVTFDFKNPAWQQVQRECPAPSFSTYDFFENYLNLWP
jgi:hypothetical protein